MSILKNAVVLAAALAVSSVAFAQTAPVAAAAAPAVTAPAAAPAQAAVKAKHHETVVHKHAEHHEKITHKHVEKKASKKAPAAPVAAQ